MHKGDARLDQGAAEPVAAPDWATLGERILRAAAVMGTLQVLTCSQEGSIQGGGSAQEMGVASRSFEPGASLN